VDRADHHIVQGLQHVGGIELTLRPDGRGLVGELVDQTQHPEHPSVMGPVLDKVVGPDVVVHHGERHHADRSNPFSSLGLCGVRSRGCGRRVTEQLTSDFGLPPTAMPMPMPRRWGWGCAHLARMLADCAYKGSFLRKLAERSTRSLIWSAALIVSG
jgi:hypothetical protein